MREPYECCYIAGRCSHPECGSHQEGVAPPHPDEPTVEGYCAAGGHAYYGDECDPAVAPPETLSTLGRCYCGDKRYPAGGPKGDVVTQRIVDDLIYERASISLFENAGAEYDLARNYRYTLWRRWDPTGPTVVFVMLNPSTATAKRLDPTVTRCVGYAKTWGFGQLTVVNLFAYRSTDPKVLKTVDDPVGPRNDEAIGRVVYDSEMVVAAWGVHAGERADEALAGPLAGVDLHCLGVTKDGHPRHPLYVPASERPVRW